MTKFTDIEAAVKIFNDRYGVQFSIGGFETKVRTLAEIGTGMTPDDLYKNKFTELYKNAFANFVDRKIGNELDCGKMIREFDKEIMEPYRQWCKERTQTSPNSYGGWGTKEYLRTVRNYLSGVSKNKIEFAENRYKNGELPIRKMRAYSEKLMSMTNPTAEQLSTLHCYATALKNVNESRSAMWKIMHPIRYRAEIREAKNFSDYIDKTTGMDKMRTGSATNINNNNSAVTSDYEEMLQIVNDGIIERSMNIVQNSLTELENKDKVEKQESNLKEKVVVDGTEINEKIVNNVKKIGEREVSSLTQTNKSI